MPLLGAVEHTPHTPGSLDPIVTIEVASTPQPAVEHANRLTQMVGQPFNNQRTAARLSHGAAGIAAEFQQHGYQVDVTYDCAARADSTGIVVFGRTIANYVATSATTTSAVTLDTWNDWNGTYTNTIGTANTIWTTTATTSVTDYLVTRAAWSEWCNTWEVIHNAGTRAAEIRRYSRRQMTDEELRVELEREKQLREEAEKRAAQAKLAQQRAEALLRSCLSAEQTEDLDKKNCFYIVVDGKNGKKERYRIDRGSHGNVKQIDEKGSIIRSFCVQPEGVPNGDQLLTQKLWLEASDETRDKFWETANITTLMREKEVPHHIPRNQRRRYAEENNLLH